MEGLYKILIFAGILIIILVTIEKLIIRNIYRQKYKLNKNSYIKILVPGISRPVYIYRSKICDCIKKLSPDELYNYEKIGIPVHISESLDKQIRNTKNSFTGIFTSGTPVSNIIRSVTNSLGIISTVDPTRNTDEIIWKALVPRGEKLNCFVRDNWLYVI